MNSEEKNLLDLKHSLYSTKASLFFSIGVGGAIALFFGIKQLVNDTIGPLLTADIWLVVFVWLSIIHFSRCVNIQKEIKKSLSKRK
tara:strand:+ start:508 stop:765 length:258 start_codon:yes stop_codon:yes gene_type:complete